MGDEDLYYASVKYLKPGTPVDFVPNGSNHGMWEVQRVSMEIVQDGVSVMLYTLAAVDDDGDFLDMPEVQVNLNMYDYKLI